MNSRLLIVLIASVLSLVFLPHFSVSYAQTSQQTIIFDDKSGQNQNLTGQYPTGLINWGTTGWWMAAPWMQFTTKSISFRSQSQTSASFTFLSPRRVVSVQAVNGGTVASTITLACTGNTTKSQSVPIGQLTTISTGWTTTCTSVTMTSSNGWNTNFDNLVIDLGDSVGPTVSLTAPTEGATVSGAAVTASANAADNVGVAGVQFKLDGNNLGAEDTTAPYSISWNTTTVTNGTHVLTAVAKDSSNNQTTSTAVNVLVNNPPSLSILTPTESQSISGSSISVTYTSFGDQTEANHAHFRLDGGTTVMDTDFDGSYTFSDVAPGNHTLVGVIARVNHTEIAGSEDTVNFVTTAPDTEAPVSLITNPTENATVSGTLTVSANVTDNVAVAGVQFKLDGNNLGVEDTSAPYSVAWNTTAVGNGSHTVLAVARDTSSNSASSADVHVTVANVDARAIVGEWGAVMNWPHIAIHTTLLNSGKVLMWDGWGGYDGESFVWDPGTNTFVTQAMDQNLYFCSGHTQLADGRVLVMGGHNNGGLGNNRSTTYNPTNNSWTAMPNISYARWYPSTTKLPDGRVLVIGGLVGSNWAQYPEIFNPATNSWSQLVTTGNYSSENDDEYPLSFRLPNGKIYTMAATVSRSYMLDVNSAVLTSGSALPRKLGTAAQYRPGKILYTGGGAVKNSGAAAFTASSVLDLNQATPAWRTVASMQNARYEHNLTIAADGQVYAIGGASVVSQETGNGTLTLEKFDPDAETWSTMASMTDRRMYHSTSLLLPDGRILSAGTGRLGANPDILTAQLYSPGYLFKGARPVIGTAPTQAGFGQTITVSSAQAQSIQKVSFIPLGTNTHTIDMNQTFIELAFTKSGNNLEVTMPTNQNIATVGDYMLFIIDGNGVPSVAKIIGLKAVVDSIAPTVSITAPVSDATVVGTSVVVSAAATDNVAVSSVQFLVDGANLGSADTVSPYSVTWNTTTIANGSHSLTARAVDSSGNVATSSAVNVIVANPVDETAPIISGVNASNLSTTGATINWTTNENADSLVEYGLTTAYGQSTTLNSTLVQNHSQVLSGLSTNTVYHYQVKSKDSSGNLVTSADFSFTTPASNPQTITFDDKTGQDQVLSGQYPTNVINWGSNLWWHSAPWGQFTTKSVSFNSSSQTSGTFSFISPKKVTRVKAYNGGSVASTVTLACSGNVTKSMSVPVGQITTIDINWTNSCTTVTVTSSNGWNTNFDDLVIE